MINPTIFVFFNNLECLFYMLGCQLFFLLIHLTCILASPFRDRHRVVGCVTVSINSEDKQYQRHLTHPISPRVQVGLVFRLLHKSFLLSFSLPFFLPFLLFFFVCLFLNTGLILIETKTFCKVLNFTLILEEEEKQKMKVGM